MAENSGEVNPQPQFEISQQPREGQEALAERAIEERPQTEGGRSRQTPQFTPPTVAQTLQVTQDQPDEVSQNSQSSKPSTGDLAATDSDRIEKQWVERAKSIVVQNQDDPYTQKKQMSRIKADYIKKRFDKTIPADDAAAT